MQNVIDYLIEKFDDKEKVVAAISGGPDSMFLLDILLKVRKKKDIDIIVAHVNHNVRCESYEEAERVKEYCLNNNLVFEYLIIDKYGNDNFHDYARNIRYNFFETLINKYGAKYLLTAHHGDDLMETILMRIVRGSTISGYAGFSKESRSDNYTVLRPLISLTKAEIEKYMNDNNLWYAIDVSNSKDVYTRNRFRKYILPKLKDEDKNVHKKFLKFSNKLNDISKFFENYIDKMYLEVNKKNKLDLTILLKEDRVVVDNILSRYLYNFYKDNIHMITDKNIDTLYKCITNNKANVCVDIPGNYKFIKAYDYAYIYKDSTKEGYKIEIKNSVVINGYGKITVLDKSDETDNNITYLNSKEISLPLYVRNRISGDKMCIKNMTEEKKIKNIFMDCKIPLDKRDNYPIVVDNNGDIVWLPGLKKSKFDRKNSGKYDIILKYE